MPQSPGVKNKKKTSIFPPFRYYFVIPFLIGLFFLCLDGMDLVGYFQLVLTFTDFIKNLSIMVVFITLCALLIAILTKSIDLALYEIIGDVKELGGASKFIFFTLFSYVNLYYFGKFLVSKNVSSNQSNLAATLLFLIFSILYFLLLRKKLILSGIMAFVNSVFRIVIFLVILNLLFTTCVYLIDSEILARALESARESGQRTAQKPNVVIITFDSLTAKHMSLYGYYRKTTPNLERFAKESFVFKRAISNSNTTMGALPCLLYGRYPRMLPTNMVRGIVNGPPAFTKVLANFGYRKSYIINLLDVLSYDKNDCTNPEVMNEFDLTPAGSLLWKGNTAKNYRWLSRLLSFGFGGANKNRLFPISDERMSRKEKELVTSLPLYFERILRILREEKDPVVIWVHLYLAHLPYSSPQEFKIFGIIRGGEYDSGILFIDDSLNDFIEKMRIEGFLDKTILIISADHGESFRDLWENIKDFYHSANWLNESVCHIPLIIRLPGQVEGKAIQTFAELTDIAPTIFELVDVPIPPSFEGESLVPYMKDENLLSKKLKICIPISFIERNKPFYVFEEEMKGEMGDLPLDHDMFNAYQYKYKAVWTQNYDERARISPFPNVFLGSEYIGIFNLFDDPGEHFNLMERQFKNQVEEPRDISIQEFMKTIDENKQIQYYRGGYGKPRAGSGRKRR